jgi:hypothetical protein
VVCFSGSFIHSKESFEARQNRCFSYLSGAKICLDLSVSLKVRLGLLPPRQKAARATNSSDESDFVVRKTSSRVWGQRMVLKILRKVGKPMNHPALDQALFKGNAKSGSIFREVARCLIEVSK